MAEQIKRASVFINNNKVAETETAEWSVETNAEQLHAQEGVIGASQGNLMCELRLNGAHPVNKQAGLQSVEDAMNDQTDVVCIYKMGVTTWQCAMRVKQGSYSSDNRSGTAKSSFTLINTENPKKLG